MTATPTPLSTWCPACRHLVADLETHAQRAHDVAEEPHTRPERPWCVPCRVLVDDLPAHDAATHSTTATTTEENDR